MQKDALKKTKAVKTVNPFSLVSRFLKNETPCLGEKINLILYYVNNEEMTRETVKNINDRLENSTIKDEDINSANEFVKNFCEGLETKELYTYVRYGHMKAVKRFPEKEKCFRLNLFKLGMLHCEFANYWCYTLWYLEELKRNS